MKVIVLGAGVIGVTCAHYLNEAGHEVTGGDRTGHRRQVLGDRAGQPLDRVAFESRARRRRRRPDFERGDERAASHTLVHSAQLPAATACKNDRHPSVGLTRPMTSST